MNSVDINHYRHYLTLLLGEVTALSGSIYVEDTEGMPIGVVQVAILTLDWLADDQSLDDEVLTCAKKLSKQLQQQLKKQIAVRSGETTPRGGAGSTASESRKLFSEANLAAAKTSEKAKGKKASSSKPRVRTKNDETEKLIDVFCEVSGLVIPASLSQAAITKLWRVPLREILDQMCDGDLGAARSAIATVCRYMRDENLTFDSPNSIIKVARSMRAQKKIGKFTRVQQDSGEEGFWM